MLMQMQTWMQGTVAVSATRTHANTYACTGRGPGAAAGASRDADADAEAGAKAAQRCHMVQWSNSPMARPHMVAGSDYHMATKLEDPPVNGLMVKRPPMLPGWTAGWPR